MYDYYVGLDLGQRKDYTALAIVEAPIWCNPKWAANLALPNGWVSPADYVPTARDQLRSLEFHHGAPEKPTLQVRHLLRYPLGTGYPDIVEDVARILASPPIHHGTAFLVDATGVGAPVVDLFRQRGLNPLAVTITGGREVNRADDNLSVPKRDLITATQVVLQGQRLKIAEELPNAAELVRELLEFRVRVTASANDTYGVWRDGQHDDLVLATAMAVWFREWYSANLDGQIGQVIDTSGLDGAIRRQWEAREGALRGR